MVERAAPRGASNKNDLICPVCLRPIKPNDRVSGVRDDLTHEECDRAMRSGQPPPAPSN